MKRHLVLIAMVMGMLTISVAAGENVQAEDTQIAVGLVHNFFNTVTYY
jgi:hypothetical protein